MLGICPCELLKTLKTKTKQLCDFKLFHLLEFLLFQVIFWGGFVWLFLVLDPEMAWHSKKIDECDIQCMDIYFHLSSFGCSTLQRTFSSVISRLEFRNMEIKRSKTDCEIQSLHTVRFLAILISSSPVFHTQYRGQNKLLWM